MFTPQNYTALVNYALIASLPDVLKKGHAFFMEATEKGTDFVFYNDDPTIKRTLDLYFLKLKEFVDSKKKAPSEKTTLPRVPVDQNGKPLAIKKVKTNHPIKVVEVKSTSVEKIDDAVRLIQRYVALHGKTKTVASILPFIKAIQKALLEKRVSKKHKHGALIEKIQNQLIDIYNKFKPTLNIPFQIMEPELSTYVKIAGGEKVYKSIGFLKRLVALQGKEVEKKQLEKFALDVDKAKLPETDPYVKKLMETFSTLKKAYQKGGAIKLSSQELRGLDGIVKICGCSTKEMGTIFSHSVKGTRQCNSKKYSNAHAGACSHHRGLKQKGLGALPSSMSACEMMQQQVNELPFSGKWQTLFGRPAEGFKLMVHGGPGSGKSSLLLELSHYFATNFGAVLYVTSEEYTPSTMKSKLSQLPNLPDNLILTASLADQNIENFKFVFLDSINHMKLSLEDFVKMKQRYPQVSFIYILQHTKEGTFRGGMDWEHEADIAAEISNYSISVYKNRYGIKGSLNFFNPERENSLNQ